MKCINELIDDQYPFNGITHTRKIARAFLLNDNNELCLLKIEGTDDFGLRDYYETPGGGVKEDEDLKDAVIREVLEETGIKASVVCKCDVIIERLARHYISYTRCFCYRKVAFSFFFNSIVCICSNCSGIRVTNALNSVCY